MTISILLVVLAGWCSITLLTGSPVYDSHTSNGVMILYGLLYSLTVPVGVFGVYAAHKNDLKYINWFSWSFWISIVALLVLQFVNFILSVVWRRSTVVECTHELNYLIVGNSSSTFIPLNQSSVNPQVIYDACKQASSLYICWTITELVVLQFMLFVYFGLVVNAYERDLRKEEKVIPDDHDTDGRDVVCSNNKENIEHEKVGIEAVAEGGSIQKFAADAPDSLIPEKSSFVHTDDL